MSGVVNFGTSKQGSEAKGESKLKDHEKWCDISFLSHGMDCPRQLGSSMATGRRNYDALKVTKPIDSASVLLWQAAVRNDSFPKVEIHLIRSRDNAKEVFFKIMLTNAVVNSHRINAATDDDDQPEEEIGLSFETIEMIYTTAGLGGEQPANVSSVDELFKGS